MKPLNITLIFLFFFSYEPVLGQKDTFLDYLNESTAIYPGCENAVNKEDCYIDEIRKLIVNGLNEQSFLMEHISEKEPTPIKIMVKNKTNGVIELAKIETENSDIEKAVRNSLRKLPLIQPMASVSQGHSVLTSISFIILIQKETGRDKLKPIIRKPQFDPSSNPYPDGDKQQQATLKGCENGNNLSCFYTAINSFINEHIDRKIKKKLKGERFHLEITITNKGEIDNDEFKCSLKDYKEYFGKLLSGLSIKEPAKINGLSKTMTYSIPIEM